MATMATGGHDLNEGSAIHRVNETLRGPVLDTLARFLPELDRLPPEHAYERTLDDIGLLHRCFAVFRAERQAFDHILVDPQRRPVRDDQTALACGRTLEQVVAMIVRTAAKRYFRRTLPTNAAPPRANLSSRHRVPPDGLVQRMAALFRGRSAVVAHRAPHQTRGLADELYDALKARLRHDWQIPLVPAYAGMTPPLVRALGDKLLEIRDLAHLHRIAADPAEAARLFETADAAPLKIPSFLAVARPRLSDLLTPDGQRLRIEAFADVVLRPDVRAQLDKTGQGLHLTEALRRVGAVPAKLMVAELGLAPEQLAVMLLLARQRLGEDLFDQVFGVPGDGAVVMRLTQKARKAGISPDADLDRCAAFVRQAFTAN